VNASSFVPQSCIPDFIARSGARRTAALAGACLLLAGALVGRALAAEPEAAPVCPADGSYRNPTFGFALTLPVGYRGCTADVVVRSDHGVTLHPASGASLDVYAGYNAPLYASAEQDLDSFVRFLNTQSEPGSVTVRRRQHTRLGRVAALRTVVTYVTRTDHQARTADLTVALRAAPRDPQPGIVSRDYAVNLDSPSSAYATDRRILQGVLHAWTAIGIAP